jgi:small subunit ribosomal protein S8
MVGNKPVLVVNLFMENRIPKIKGVSRISKTSKRIYKKFSEIRLVKNGYGAVVLSTPKGILSGRDARKEKVGGEILFTIW